MRRGLAAVVLLAAMGACATSDEAIPIYAPPQGINQVLEGTIAAAPGHTLILGDLNMAPGADIPRHYHYGEEFIYVLGGSATVSRAGLPDVTLGPGDTVIIPPGVVHWGKAGPQGLRSISNWVKDDAKPLREPVAE